MQVPQSLDVDYAAGPPACLIIAATFRSAFSTRTRIPHQYSRVLRREYPNRNRQVIDKDETV
jgi:hypothetical protein